jgi:hypothetical protein
MTLVFISSMKTWHWYLFPQWKHDTGIYFLNEIMTPVFISSMKTWHWYLLKHDTGIYFLNEDDIISAIIGIQLAMFCFIKAI